MIKEIPMLFSTPMVTATLDGRKTKTRRMKGLELQNENPDEWELVSIGHLEYAIGKHKPENHFGATLKWKPYGSCNFMKCPYGQPGDIIWVRETWAHAVYFNGLREECHVIFKTQFPEPVAWNWKPSIHLPKAAARIWLEITDIKVERLKSITEEDAIAEGIKFEEDGGQRCYYFYPCNDIRDDSYIPNKGLYVPEGAPRTSGAQISFTSLWASLNGWDSWKANPWVWVITFKVLSTTGKPYEQLTEVCSG